MKAIIISAILTVATSTLHAKPGGWIKDFFQGASISYSSTHCNHYPTYYERPAYYVQPAVVYYERPAVYYTHPHNIQMRPYQQFYQSSRCNRW